MLLLMKKNKEIKSKPTSPRSLSPSPKNYANIDNKYMFDFQPVPGPGAYNIKNFNAIKKNPTAFFFYKSKKQIIENLNPAPTDYKINFKNEKGTKIIKDERKFDYIPNNGVPGIGKYVLPKLSSGINVHIIILMLFLFSLFLDLFWKREKGHEISENNE